MSTDDLTTVADDVLTSMQAATTGEKQRVETEIIGLKVAMQRDLADARKRCKNHTMWQTERMSVESTFADRRRPLISQQKECDLKLSAIRAEQHRRRGQVAIAMRAQRDANRELVGNERDRSELLEIAPEAKRADGGCELWIIMLLILEELRTITDAIAKR